MRAAMALPPRPPHPQGAVRLVGHRGPTYCSWLLQSPFGHEATMKKINGESAGPVALKFQPIVGPTTHPNSSSDPPALFQGPTQRAIGPCTLKNSRPPG